MPFPLKRGQCLCLTVAVSLMKKIDLQGNTKAVLLAKAAKLLVLAVMMDLVPVIEALLSRVLNFIKSQLLERVQPALTAGQIGILHGKHRDITERLVQRVAKAHADQLQQDIPFSRVA
jgi:hypothetical protein